MANNKRRAKRTTATPTSTAAPRRRPDYRAKNRVVEAPGFAALLAIKSSLPAVAPPPAPRLCWDEPAPGKW